MKAEVDGITFWSSDNEDLEKIGGIVKTIKSDDTILQLTIDKAIELDIMK